MIGLAPFFVPWEGNYIVNKRKGLTIREYRFLKGYIETGDIGPSYHAVYPKITKKSAHELGSRMLKRIKKKSTGKSCLTHATLAKPGCYMSSIANWLRRSRNIIWINLWATTRTMQRKCGRLNYWPICWALKSRR